MPINTSFIAVLSLSFWGIRQAYCPYAFRFSEIFQKNSLNFLRFKSGRERGRKKEKREKEKDEKLAKLAKLDKLEKYKRAEALLPLSLFSYPTSFLVPVPVPIVIYISL